MARNKHALRTAKAKTSPTPSTPTLTRPTRKRNIKNGKTCEDVSQESEKKIKATSSQTVNEITPSPSSRTTSNNTSKKKRSSSKVKNVLANHAENSNNHVVVDSPQAKRKHARTKSTEDGSNDVSKPSTSKTRANKSTVNYNEQNDTNSSDSEIYELKKKSNKKSKTLISKKSGKKQPSVSTLLDDDSIPSTSSHVNEPTSTNLNIINIVKNGSDSKPAKSASTTSKKPSKGKKKNSSKLANGDSIENNEPKPASKKRVATEVKPETSAKQPDLVTSTLKSARDLFLKRRQDSLLITSPSKRDADNVNNSSSHFVRHKNFVDFVNRLQIGQPSFKINPPTPEYSPIVNHFTDLKVYKTESPFDRRATCMTWHPSNSSALAVGSKGGDIFFWKFDPDGQPKESECSFLPGIGVGGQVLAMKFDARNPTMIYTAAVDGKVSLRDLTGVTPSQTLLDTNNWESQWFCSMDVNFEDKTLIAGDSLGNVTLMSTENNKSIWSDRLHKTKVTHAEFSLKENWLLATASLDNTLKIWDLRNMRGRDGALYVCPHEKGVNSAYFSLTDGTKILTTDQGREIRVYKGPLWELDQTVLHPHRHFQHLTNIKAYWHPLVDLIVVGRYPDENFPGYVAGERRSIDLINPESGETLHKLTEQGVSLIISLNQFNRTGETLASCMGSNILVWKRQSLYSPPSVGTIPGSGPRPQRKNRGDGMMASVMSKLKSGKK